MSLAAGTRLGSFEIVATLGAGGMGEVYRARDTRLGREVALKFVLDAFVGDQERLSRFEREARALAALNHPGIATLYGLEQAATPESSSPVHILVMELVEGVTLAEKLDGAKGASGAKGAMGAEGATGASNVVGPLTLGGALHRAANCRSARGGARRAVAQRSDARAFRQRRVARGRPSCHLVGRRQGADLHAGTGRAPQRGDRIDDEGLRLRAGPPFTSGITHSAPGNQRPFDAARDGTRILGLRAADASGEASGTPRMQVVLNWTEELRARAPVK